MLAKGLGSHYRGIYVAERQAMIPVAFLSGYVKRHAQRHVSIYCWKLHLEDFWTSDECDSSESGAFKTKAR
jgi:hypothetical protein